MSEVERLALRVADLSSKADFWNNAVLIFLLVTALAAAGIVICQRLAFIRAGQMSDAQNDLIRAKDAQLRRDLDDRDLKIAEAKRDASTATGEAARLTKENLVLQADLLKLRKEAEPRRLSGEQKERFARFLASHPAPIGVVSRLVDTEASDFADDFDVALKTARWETLRIKNRISSKYGVSISFVSAVAPNSVPELKLLDQALTEIGVPHQIEEFKVGDASMSPAFQDRGLYLVVDEKPPAKK